MTYFFGGGVAALYGLGILVSRPGWSRAMAVRLLNPNHWTARELPKRIPFDIFFFFCSLCGRGNEEYSFEAYDVLSTFI